MTVVKKKIDIAAQIRWFGSDDSGILRTVASVYSDRYEPNGV